ncbi:TRAP transporter large permease [Psychrobacillus sp. FSL K6-2365]|uniref:TRAP transporter large permease n=1 Tax=Psychrobacillus TaxID=1221880 RepID=UPI0008E53DF9|nr:TRAP transporter large permease [Psychrobacillus psychrodurans]MCZ8539072.1 TRAP transporter large permease [Psychrobacillus psychrodurans]SFM27850.1 TRAP transporter, DctM subunit [Psychrobacillus psychrodurans]
MDVALQAALILLICVAFLLIIGAPIAVSLGIASVLAMISIMDFNNSLLTSAQRMFAGTNSFTLLAIPFFVLAGVIMNNGGIALRLINCAKVLSGRLPGSLAHTNIVANMMFGSISGSAVAAAAAVGSTMGPLQAKEGYDRNFNAAVNIASAPTGMLIPPSNTLIVYSLVSGGTSIAALFMAGYIPGIMWGLGCMIVAYFMAKKRGYKSDERVSLRVALRVFLDAIPSLFLIIIVIGGIIYGVFTATEGSAIAVVYSLLLSFVYKTIKVKDLPRILLDSTRTTSIVIFLIGVSSIMSWVMAFTNIPGIIADTLLALTDNIYIILLIMNLVLLIVGTFMDPTPAVLIFTPIFLPIAVSFGVDPVHFGIMLIFNLSIGTITPPVGPVLFVGAKVANLKIESIIKPLIPFFVVTVAILIIVTYIPSISLFIPELFGLVK